MLKSFSNAVCWLARHEGSVLVLTENTVRLVAGTRDAVGLSRGAALALTLAPSRRRWFDVEQGGGRSLLKLNDAGRTFHDRLVERRKCACPAPAPGVTTR